MDLIICGVVDIVIVLAFIVVCMIGYKNGFIKKALGMVSFVVALTVAIIFCTQFATILKNLNLIYPNIYDSIFSTVSSSNILSNPDASISDILVSLDVPRFVADIVAAGIGQDIHAKDIAIQITEYVTTIAMNVISFFILFLGVFVAAFILKIIAAILRQNAFVRFVDGTFGLILYASLYMAFIYVAFTVVRYMMDAEWFLEAKEFLVVDMMLDNPDKFRLSKFIYEHNVIYKIIDSFI